MQQRHLDLSEQRLQLAIQALADARRRLLDGDADTLLLTVASSDGQDIAVVHRAIYCGDKPHPRNHIVDLALRMVRCVTATEPAE